MKRPAVFLDRDGTINEQMGYVNHLSRFILLPRAAEGISLLNKQGYLTIVVTNQSGVDRGYFPMELVEKINAHMKTTLEKRGAVIDGIFFCPHRPSAECECRKPKPGLIEQAVRTFDIEIERSYIIGDTCSDIELGYNSGLQGILVKTGYGLGEIEHVLPGSPYTPVYIAEDLLDGAEWIIEKGSGPLMSV